MNTKGKLTKEEVIHIAELANINLTEEEVGIYMVQLSDVLNYIEKLQEIDTENVKPTYQTLDGTVNVFRQDEVEKGFTEEEALKAAKKVYQSFFLTKNVFKEKDKSISQDGHQISRRKKDNYNSVLTIINEKGNLGHKDLFMTKGIETTAGSKVLEGYIAQYSSTVVDLLEKSGFVTKYKLNQDAWGHGSSGENSDFGPTTNPWDTRRVSGGSSSGSGVSVATQDVEVATGTDTCGSIRLPASFLNICGIKPTYGALSRFGVIAFASSLDCPGLFARDITKLKKVFNMVSKPDKRDSTTQSFKRNSEISKAKKIIGFVEEFLTSDVHPEIKQIILEARKTFEKLGYTFKNIKLPYAKYGIAAYYLIAPTETSSNLARYDGIRYGQDRSFFGAEAKRRIMLGTFASSKGYADKYYEKAARIRTLIIKDFSEAFKKVDVVLMPISPTPPFLIGEKVNDPIKMYLSDIFAAPPSLSGIPSLSLPCGFTKDGLPIGMQLAGPRWSEERLFELGKEYQKVTDFHTRRPK